MCIHIADAHRRPCSELVLHRQIALLHIWIPEIWNEDVNRLAPCASCGRRRKRIRICDEWTTVPECGPPQKYELPGNPVRDQSVRHVEQVFLDKEYSERPADHGVALSIQRIRKPYTWRDIIVIPWNFAGERKRRIANCWLCQLLVIPAHSIVQIQLRSCLIMILREQRIGRNREQCR